MGLLTRKIEKAGQAWVLYCPRDPAVQGPKVIKEAWLVERRVGFILHAGNQRGGRQWTPVQRSTSPQ